MIDIETLKPLDYLLVILSLFFIFFSAWKGFIISFLSLVTWVGSIFITIYFHGYLSNLILSKISQYEILVTIIPNLDFVSRYIISIPIIFFISIYILKKFRKFIIADLDKGFFGIIIDKFFGILFGIIFCYSILTTLLISGSIFEYKYLNEKIIPNIKNNSSILLSIEEINEIIKPKTSEFTEEIY